MIKSLNCILHVGHTFRAKHVCVKWKLRTLTTESTGSLTEVGIFMEGAVGTFSLMSKRATLGALIVANTRL